jgi:hypothetical protein
MRNCAILALVVAALGFFYCFSVFAEPRGTKPTWAPENWGQYLDELYQEYLQKLNQNDGTLGPKYINAQITDFPNGEKSDALNVMLTGELISEPPKPVGSQRLDEVQYILKDNVQTNPLFGSSAYLEENLVPDTDNPWRTDVWPLELPTDNSQTARCLVRTFIMNPHTITDRYKIATLPISKGAARAILRKLNRPDISQHIVIHQLSRDAHTNRVQIDTANRFHIKIIHRILAEVFPDYASRRHWTESFIRDLYFTAMNRRMSTNYDIIRDIKSGRILATLGMDTVNYGAVKYFDKVTNRYQLSFGPMTALQDAMFIMNPLAGSSFDFLKWNAPIPALGLESENLLPRPLVEVAHLPPIQLDARLEAQMLKLLPPGMHPDLSRGVTFYEGRIGEPTKFKVVRKDELRDIAYDEIISSLTDIFPICRSTLFHFWGQTYYTYNPEDIGVALYAKLGYPLHPSLPPITVGNEKWPIQANRPTELSKTPGIYSLYHNNLSSAIRRLSKCINLLKRY